MAELAFDEEGNPFRFSRQTKKLRARRMKNASQRGTCVAGVGRSWVSIASTRNVAASGERGWSEICGRAGVIFVNRGPKIDRHFLRKAPPQEHYPFRGIARPTRMTRRATASVGVPASTTSTVGAAQPEENRMSELAFSRGTTRSGTRTRPGRRAGRRFVGEPRTSSTWLSPDIASTRELYIASTHRCECDGLSALSRENASRCVIFVNRGPKIDRHGDPQGPSQVQYRFRGIDRPTRMTRRDGIGGRFCVHDPGRTGRVTRGVPHV
jgi:hypothetical protein